MIAGGVTSFSFWAAVAAGVLLLVPLTRPRARAAAFLAINFGFLAALQGVWFAATLAGLVASWLLLQVVARKDATRNAAFALALLVALGLFVLHKAPALSSLVPRSLDVALGEIGFSYVFLRYLDALVAVRDGRDPPLFVDHANFLVPFHMLAAGPIQPFQEFRTQPPVPEPLDFAAALAAIERIVLGLFKKLVVAHAIERVFLTGFRSTGAYYVLEVHLFLPWLYLDFSSYSDIAVGVGRLLGVATPENFDRPYLARDPVDFWNRWHMTLSGWTRRNLFVPIQLALQRRWPERSPLLTSSFALLVSFAAVGLWHAVSLPYLLWGLMHAVGVVIANAARTLRQRKLGRKRYQEWLARPLPRLVGIAVTFEFVAWSLSLVGGR